MQGLEDFKNLTELDLRGNHISDPNELIKLSKLLPHLTKLDIRNNPLNMKEAEDICIKAFSVLTHLNGKSLIEEGRIGKYKEEMTKLVKENKKLANKVLKLKEHNNKLIYELAHKSKVLIAKSKEVAKSNARLIEVEQELALYKVDLCSVSPEATVESNKGGHKKVFVDLENINSLLTDSQQKVLEIKAQLELKSEYLAKLQEEFALVVNNIRPKDNPMEQIEAIDSIRKRYKEIMVSITNDLISVPIRTDLKEYYPTQLNTYNNSVQPFNEDFDKEIPKLTLSGESIIMEMQEMILVLAKELVSSGKMQELEEEFIKDPRFTHTKVIRWTKECFEVIKNSINKERDSMKMQARIPNEKNEKDIKKDDDLSLRVVRRAMKLLKFIKPTQCNLKDEIEYWRFLDLFTKSIRSYIRQAEELKLHLYEKGIIHLPNKLSKEIADIKSILQTKKNKIQVLDEKLHVLNENITHEKQKFTFNTDDNSTKEFTYESLEEEY